VEGVVRVAEVHVHAHVDDVHAGEAAAVGGVVGVAAQEGVVGGGLPGRAQRLLLGVLLPRVPV
jgi:hypothetical protein